MKHEQRSKPMLGDGDDVIDELLNRIGVRVSDTDGGDGNGGKGGNGGRGGRGERRDPFDEMSRALFGHMHTLHKGFAEHILSLVNALVQADAERRDEIKDLRCRIEALEAAAKESGR
jgi:hypothetical protein